MPVIYKGFDPDLGAKFLGESKGLIIGLGRAATGACFLDEDEDEDEEPDYEMVGLDAQQQHDLMMERRQARLSATTKLARDVDEER